MKLLVIKIAGSHGDELARATVQFPPNAAEVVAGPPAQVSVHGTVLGSAQV